MAELSTLARPYARAAYACAREHDQVEDWAVLLELLAVAMCEQHLTTALSSPALSPGQRLEILQQLLVEKPVSDYFLSFLQLLATNKRLYLLKKLYELFRQLQAADQKVIRVSITSARKLTATQGKQLAGQLKAQLKQDIELTTAEDKSLLAGAVIRIGDSLIDGSLRGRLNGLATAVGA